MAYYDMREWIERLEKEGELARIHEEVDWDLEIGGIAREVVVVGQQRATVESGTGQFRHRRCQGNGCVLRQQGACRNRTRVEAGRLHHPVARAVEFFFRHSAVPPKPEPP